MKPSDLKNKLVLAHAGFSNRSASQRYRENSIAGVTESAATDYIDIIELDLRKSSDGVLYRFHGNLLRYYTMLKFPLRFETLQRWYQVDTLADMLRVIPSHKCIFLDIKNTSVTRADLLGIFTDKEFQEVIIGNKSVRYLRQFTDMPTMFVKILNGNVLCNFYNLTKLRAEGFKYFEVVFAWQLGTKAVQRVAHSGLILRISGLGFFSSKHYWRTIKRHNITHVSSDFIE